MHRSPNFSKLILLIIFSFIGLAANAQLPNALRSSFGNDGLHLYFRRLLSFDPSIGPPLDLESPSSDPSISQFGEMNSNNNDLFLGESTNGNESFLNSPLSSSDDDPFFDDFHFTTAADCSSSDTPPLMSKTKSRIRQRRRQDTLPVCAAPLSGDSDTLEGDESSLPKLPTSLGTLEFLEEGLSNSHEQNPNCPAYSNGILPFGVCSSWDPTDRSPSTIQPLPIDWGQFAVWDVYHCNLGMYVRGFFPLEIEIEIENQSACVDSGKMIDHYI